MTKKSAPAAPELSKADQQVVADEAAAEVVYQAEVKVEAAHAADDELAKLPACTQAVVKGQTAEALAAKNAGGKS
jgi:hypothetical protein